MDIIRGSCRSLSAKCPAFGDEAGKSIDRIKDKDCIGLADT